jgi:hypothetical protein
MSDTRAVALMLATMRDQAALKHIASRFVIFSTKSTKLFGDWRNYGGIRVSNLNWIHELERVRHNSNRWELLEGEGE